MGGLKFLELSYDLQALIISFVTRPTDLKNLCLSCKALRDIAVRQLYRQVELDVGCEADLKISALLSRSNPGLDHIRTLLLRPEPEEFVSLSSSLPRTPSPPPPPVAQPFGAPPPVIIAGLGAPPPPPPPPPPATTPGAPRIRVREEVKKRWRPAHFTVRLLIELLPENILEKFLWSSYDEFSVENFVLLCKKQKKLKWIDVGPMKGSLKEALDKHPQLIRNMEQLHSLDLYPDNIDCLEACHKILRSTPKLDQLWIESGSTTSIDQPWEDESNKPGLLTSTLFKDKMPFQACTPMTLKLLSLHKVNLRWAAQTYMRVIRFPNLEELDLRCCDGADALFAEMSKPAKRPTKLKSLSFVQWTEGRNHQYIQSALESFLMAISSLKKLYVNLIETSQLPKVEAVVNHAATLKSLVLHSSSVSVVPFTTYRAYTLDAFTTLCKQCTKLEQLAIACPEINIFEEEFSPLCFEYLKNVFALPELVTFNSTAWPEVQIVNVNSRGGKLPAAVYEHLVQRAAQAIFDRKDQYAREHNQPAGKLRVVALGHNSENGWPDCVSGPVQQLIYARGALTDPYGDGSMLAVPVKLSALRFLEPCVDILSHRFPDGPPATPP